MSRRVVEEVQAQERQELGDGSRPEVPLPCVTLDSVPAGDRPNDNGNDGRDIGNDDANMPPFVGKEL